MVLEVETSFLKVCALSSGLLIAFYKRLCWPGGQGAATCLLQDAESPWYRMGLPLLSRGQARFRALLYTVTAAQKLLRDPMKKQMNESCMLEIPQTGSKAIS